MLPCQMQINILEKYHETSNQTQAIIRTRTMKGKFCENIWLGNVIFVKSRKTKFGNVKIRVLLQFPTSYAQFLLVNIPELSCCKL